MKLPEIGGYYIYKHQDTIKNVYIQEIETGCGYNFDYSYILVKDLSTGKEETIKLSSGQLGRFKELSDQKPTISNSETIKVFHEEEAKKWLEAGKGDYYSSGLYANRKRDEELTQQNINKILSTKTISVDRILTMISKLNTKEKNYIKDILNELDVWDNLIKQQP
jgi:hypothetical protein